MTKDFWEQVDDLYMKEQEKLLDPEMVKFLEGVVGCCESNSYSQHMLWHEYHESPRFSRTLTWEQVSPGWSDYAGWVDVVDEGKFPVFLSLSITIVGGHRILFYHATSRIVDHHMVRAWLEKYIPATARDVNGRINNTDAMNFSNCIPRG